jgi:hypothetical protein
MNIDGYVNPRTLGNTEFNETLHMDLFFEQELWDRYIANKKVERRDLYAWDAFSPFYFKLIGLARAGCNPLPGDTIGAYQVKIGHHAPCPCRMYVHPHYLALCIGLAPTVRQNN